MLEKKKALEMALNQIEKQFGRGAVMKLGEEAPFEHRNDTHRCHRTRYSPLVLAAFPGEDSRNIRPEASGKTTVALHIIAEAQKMGGDAAL